MNITFSNRAMEIVHEAVGWIAFLFIAGLGVGAVLVAQWAAATLASWGPHWPGS